MLSGWTGSFVSLCLPSFVSRCLPAWMPGAALWVDGFICLPLSPRMSGTPLFPFICLPLSPSLDAWHCFWWTVSSPFVSLHLAPVVSQPGCLSRLSRRTDSLVSLVPLHLFPISVGGRIHLFPFVSLYLSPVVSQPGCLARLSGWTDSFVSRCLPAWMCGTHAPQFPSLPAVLSFWRGLVCLRLWPWPCLVDVGDRVLLCLPFIWTSWARDESSSLSIVGYTLSVRSVPRYQLRSRADDSGALRCAASATRRLC